MNSTVKKGMAFLVVTTVLLGSMAAALADDLQPNILIPKIVHNLGKVYERDSYEYNFPVKNTGKADLVIDNVKPG